MNAANPLKEEADAGRDARPITPEQCVLAPADTGRAGKRWATLAAFLGAAGFDLHYTTWGIYIVAHAVQSHSVAAVCSAATFAQVMTR